MRTQNPDKIADAVDNIDAKVPPEKVPEEDRSVLAKARNMVPKLSSKKCKGICFIEEFLLIN